MEKRRKNPLSSSNVEDGIGLYVDDEYNKKHKSFNIWIVGFSLILLGFIFYALIYVIKGAGSTDALNQVQHNNASPPITSNIKFSDVEQPILSKDETQLHDKFDNKNNNELIPSINAESLEAIQKRVNDAIETIRTMKKNGVVIETDQYALTEVLLLQNELRKLIPLKYGEGPYYIEMKLEFPESMPDYSLNGKDGSLIIELAPIDLVPYSVYYFLELASAWKGGAFHRNAGHVLQAMIYKNRQISGLAFQEYHKDFPHKILTLGYAGRPGGPAFYISTQDNVQNHGPGSQGSETEADSCFGKIYKGEEVVSRMKKQPGASKPNGFINDSNNYINIPSIRLLSPDQVKEL